METEKSPAVSRLDIPPAYVASAPSKAWSKRAVIASVYAAAVSAALVVVIIVGGLYIHEKRTQDITVKEVYLPDDLKPVWNFVEADRTNGDALVIVETGKPGHISAIAAINNKTAVAGLYFPDKKECIVGFGAYDALAEWFGPTEPNVPVSVSDFYTREQIELFTDRSEMASVQDLPKKLQGLCTGLPVYKASVEIKHPGGHQRQARSAYPVASCCHCSVVA